MTFEQEMKNKIDRIEAKNIEICGNDTERGLLKDFQKDTVNRIDELFRNNQNRVLVADEVGMGKTMIAKGTIAKVAKIRLEEEDSLFKVIYICSNQAIAKQNIKTLDILNTKPVVEDTRLSMQHLQVMKQENSEDVLNNYIQLIPLTPGTSFDTNGGGNVNERALICAVLELADEFKDHIKALRKILMKGAGSKTWEWQLNLKREDLKKVIKQLKTETANLDDSIYKKEYPYNILNELRKEEVEIDGQKKNLFKVILETCSLIEEKKCYARCNYLTAYRRCQKCPHNDSKCYRTEIISALRKAFARISTDMLNPDLIIMDEFQRFNSLIQVDNDSDAGMLAQRFLKENKEDTQAKTRVLLLSATPYKLFSTMEEINEGTEEDPYKEFFTVMDFLFEQNKEKFQKEWKEYSAALRTAQINGFELLKNKKEIAENEMYQGVCRTERLSVMDGEDFIDVKGIVPKEFLKVTKEDIQSYMQAQQLIMECGNKQNVPIDYIKSCPYIMSFMENYVLKKDIRKSFKNGSVQNIETANKPLLWLNKEQIEKYEELPEVNARLKMLKEEAFENNAEKLLWCPPTKPYYQLSGAYKGIKNFSKTLIFSSWEMVPKMISTLLSYEQERKVRSWKENKKNYSDYEHGGRLKLEIDKLGGKQLFSALYPSQYLSSIYNPIDYLNEGKSIEEIKVELKKKILEKLVELKKYEGEGDSNDWYIASLLLMDDESHVKNWLERVKLSIQDIKVDDSQDTDDDLDEEDYEEKEKKAKRELDKNYKNCIVTVEQIFNSKNLGKQPQNLADFLVNVTLASFATCYYRSCRDFSSYMTVEKKEKTPLENATEFGRAFIRNFNTPEVMEILDYVDQSSEDAETGNYLSRVYKYCVNGCFQGMLDEYIHLLYRGDDSFQEDLIKNLNLLDTAKYEIDTYEAFKKEISGEKDSSSKIRMRSHFAICFSKSTDKSVGDRKENLRNAFNSPLRPFVLASTSVGQEGLDFHNYCRKIMHWNLPSNPVDLEQREGRINRYKCLCIRQNVAKLHGDLIFNPDKTLWNQMFEEAKEKENGGQYSELIPFWVFGKNQEIKLKRIVPIYPMSSDVQKYERLIKILSLYRMTLGQPRQEELLEYVFANCDDEQLEKMKELFIDLSPWSWKKRR